MGRRDPALALQNLLAVLDTRLSLLKTWLQGLSADYRLEIETLAPASNDASFRRYFRVLSAETVASGSGPRARSYVVMDAPPPMEDVKPFIRIAELFGASGATFPKVHESDVAQGFLLLEDFGNTTYLEVLNQDTFGALYNDACDALVKLQKASRPDVLPPYDAALLRRELDLYPEWYLGHHKKHELNDKDRAVIENAFKLLIENNLAQPQVFVHRDFHSRNLMLLAGDRNPGILDFQDAVYGPITYDLVSLLRDAYVVWEEDQVIDCCVRYWQKARAAGLPVSADFSDFYRDFEWMGLQRHIKVLGIFARLNYRDGKDRYLQDMPLVLNYVIKTANRYRVFGPLLELIERIEPQAVTSGFTF